MNLTPWSGSSLTEQAAKVVQKIRVALSHAFTLNDITLNMAPSIGVAQYPVHGLDERQLLEHADKAMYSAKNARLH
jgi:diguanylate cyclase (GGDEF)-like protein